MSIAAVPVVPGSTDLPSGYPHPHASEEARAIAERGMILRVQVGSGVHGTSITGQDDRDEQSDRLPSREPHSSIRPVVRRIARSLSAIAWSAKRLKVFGPVGATLANWNNVILRKRAAGCPFFAAQALIAVEIKDLLPLGSRARAFGALLMRPALAHACTEGLGVALHDCTVRVTRNLPVPLRLSGVVSAAPGTCCFGIGGIADSVALAPSLAVRRPVAPGGLGVPLAPFLQVLFPVLLVPCTGGLSPAFRIGVRQRTSIS